MADQPNGSVMESWRITFECVANRGHEGAWDEAVRRLREIYDAQREAFPERTLILSISREDTGHERTTGE